MRRRSASPRRGLVRVVPLALGVALLAVACAESPVDLGPMGARCAALVGFYLGVDVPVAVTGGEVDSETRRARIDYRTERAGLPVEGVALCRFRMLADGRFELSGAFVDESRLQPGEIDAFNASLDPARAASRETRADAASGALQ